MPVLTQPIHEHGTPGDPNYPHPMGGKAQLSSLGDERDDTGNGAPPAVGQPFLVLRVGNTSIALDNRNAGNAEAIVDLYMRALDSDDPWTLGNTLHVHEVTLTKPVAGYQRYLKGVPSPLHTVKVPVVPGAVGRHAYANGTGVIYAFPDGGAFTSRHLASMPLDVQQWGSVAEQAKVLRAYIAQHLLKRS